MSAPASHASFAASVVRWQKLHGRHDLPWQRTRDPYRVWLSEIMLQQTQVATVRGYYDRFLQRFADVQALAAAAEDEVLGLWSGLGYYSRARNLHRCAQQVVAVHGGKFPDTADVLATLPGIGRSTAAAIASLCFGQPVAIMDANVRRVVARVHAFDQDLAEAKNERALWVRAEQLLPSGARAKQSMPAYTQGMMDLGAMVCVPRKPLCQICPVQPHCAAQAAGDPERYPVRSRTLKRSSEALWLLWATTTDGQVWLQRRPATGVWAGLYCLPAFSSEAALRAAVPARYAGRLHVETAFTHVLTHRDLHLHPCRLELEQVASLKLPGDWVGPAHWPALGLPAPIRKLLERNAAG